MKISTKEMKKTNILAPFQIQIDFAAVEPLGTTWNHSRLPGIHWRLYHNDAPGAVLIYPDGRRIELLPDALYLLLPNNRLSSENTGPAKQLFLHFSIHGCFENPEESLSVIPLNRNLRMQVGRLRKRLEQENASPLTQLHALQLVLQLLIALHERLHLEPIDSRISRVCEAMKNDPARNWSNADGAEMCDLAVNAFIRKFRMETGMPPYRYLTCLRYSIAANLLESSSMGLKEICGKIGIKDPFHFSREFKRIYERPPSVHRKRRYIQTTDLRQTPEEESGNPPTPR